MGNYSGLDLPNDHLRGVWGCESQAGSSLRGGECASREHPASIDFYFVMVEGAAFVFECSFIRCTLINKKSSLWASFGEMIC